MSSIGCGVVVVGLGPRCSASRWLASLSPAGDGAPSNIITIIITHHHADTIIVRHCNIYGQGGRYLIKQIFKLVLGYPKNWYSILCSWYIYRSLYLQLRAAWINLLLFFSFVTGIKSCRVQRIFTTTTIIMYTVIILIRAAILVVAYATPNEGKLFCIIILDPHVWSEVIVVDCGCIYICV